MKEPLSEKFRCVARGLHSSGHADKAAGWHFAADEVEELEKRLAEMETGADEHDEVWLLHDGERYCSVSVHSDINESYKDAYTHSGYHPVKALVPRPKG